MLYRNLPNADGADHDRIAGIPDHLTGSLGEHGRVGDRPQLNIKRRGGASLLLAREQPRNPLIVPVDRLRDDELALGDAQPLRLLPADRNQLGCGPTVSGDHNLGFGATF